MGLETKPTVILLHGAWHGGWCWHGNFREFFQDKGFEIVTPDLPSHGDRMGESPMWRNRVNTYVSDIERLVQQFAEPPVLIGHSLGGFIAQHLLARGVLLKGVGLLASVPVKDGWKANIRALRAHPLAFLRTCLSPRLRYPKAAARSLFLGSEAKQEQADFLHSKLQGASHLALLDTLIFNRPTFPKSNVPICIVGGGKDTLFPTQTQHALAERLSASCHIVPNAPHDLMLSAEWEVAANHFLDWIESL